MAGKKLYKPVIIMSQQNPPTALTLDSLLLLIALLPLDSEGASLTAPMTAHAMAQYHELAAHVESLQWVETEHSELQLLDQMVFLSLPNPSTADLLPKLHTLTASCISTAGARSLARWIPSSLTAVDISVKIVEDDRAATSLLSALEGCVSHLTSFTFAVRHEAVRSQPMLHQAMLSALRSMPALRVAAIPFYASPGDHLDTLSAMAHLKTLSIHIMEPSRGYRSIEEGSRYTAFSIQPPMEDSITSLEELSALIPLPDVPTPPVISFISNPFPCLQTLHLEGSFENMIDILHIRFLPMQYLSLKAQSLQTPWEMKVVTQAIVNNCPHIRLVHIHIERPENLAWIDVRPLGTLPCAIFVAKKTFRRAVMNPQIVEGAFRR
ncbi:hypothetical protein HWV62_23052 [Athelia sp. TMB]|nr:hypothetical protein HWV62_23052 [Athelia sp. TMB]